MSFITQLCQERNDYTMVVGTSNWVPEADFNIIKVITNGIVQNITKYSKDSRIMVIGFSDKTNIISEFSNNTDELEKNIKQKLVSQKGRTFLDVGLKESKTRINKENNNIVIVIIGNLLSDSPKETIGQMISNGIKFLIIGVGKAQENQLNSLFPGQKILIFKEYDHLIENIIKLKPACYDFPLCYKISPAKNSIQCSSDNLNILFTIWPKDNYQIFKENEIEIDILGNEYYHGSKVVVEKQVSFNKKYVANIELIVVQNGFNRLPESIFFQIKVAGKIYKGYFYLDMGLFASDFHTSEIVRIVVDGNMGAGKSSILNLLYNNFTSGNVVDQHFFASKNDSHTTKGVHFCPIAKILRTKNLENSLLPIQNEIMEKNKIELVDKAGIVNLRENILDYSLLAKGHYRHNTEKIQNDGPNSLFECHAFIFIAAMGSLSIKSEFEHIVLKFSELINKAGIQPILVITFSDIYPKNEVEDIKIYINKNIPVHEKNTFFITPYINGETKRDPNKDMQGRELLCRAIEIGKQTIRNKNIEKENLLNLKVGKLNLCGEDNGFNKPGSIKSPDMFADKEETVYIISVFYNGMKAKFKVPSSSTANELRQLVEGRFNITSLYCLEDSDECIISGEYKLEKILGVENNQANVSVKLL